MYSLDYILDLSKDQILEILGDEFKSLDLVNIRYMLVNKLT